MDKYLVLIREHFPLNEKSLRVYKSKHKLSDDEMCDYIKELAELTDYIFNHAWTIREEWGKYKSKRAKFIKELVRLNVYNSPQTAYTAMKRIGIGATFTNIKVLRKHKQVLQLWYALKGKL